MKRLRTILTEISAELNGLGFKQNDRNNLSAALYDVSLDHASAITDLLDRERPIFSSSYALMRPMFECFVRAAWLRHCASDLQIQSIIKKDRFPLSLSDMVESIEKETEWESALKTFMETAIKNMHSYTHGGMQLVSRRIKDGILEHVFDQKEIDDIIKRVVLLAFVSFCEMTAIAETSKKDAFVQRLYVDITEMYFPEAHQEQH